MLSDLSCEGLEALHACIQSPALSIGFEIVHTVERCRFKFLGNLKAFNCCNKEI